ncbi:hypothetical protein Tco_0840289 [Tanacetum coccineum]|uniref:Uncharacterized protein n=1 Tax=Tanacetum coccineum TaxID=301880 RepID=A0ABQ5AVT4_9ASTR
MLNNSACHVTMSLPYILIIKESLPYVPDVYGQSLEALPSQPAASRSESHIPSGGDECEDGAMDLARRSPVEGGDSEISGDGGGVGMARSLSTSASGGRDMEA